MEESKRVSSPFADDPVGGVVEQGQFDDSSDEDCVQGSDDLYDEAADAEDEKWVDTHMRKEVTSQRGGDMADPTRTDAILSCPACFTTVCYDCQRHTTYHNQFRAMFLANCEVKIHTRLAASSRVVSGVPKGRKSSEGADRQAVGRETGTVASEQEEDAEILHSVVCSVCGTEVGVQDAEGVAHLFHVIAS